MPKGKANGETPKESMSLDDPISSTPDLGSTTLSEREKEVLFLAGEGLTDKEIALRLNIGAKTVRTYWDRMRAKLGAASRTEVLAKALQSAHDQLAASEQRIRMFVQHMPVIFNALDEDMNVILANDECERLTGFGNEEILGQPLLSEHHIPDVEERNKVLGQFAEQNGDYRDLETEIRCKDGSQRIIAWSSRAQQNPIPGWSSWAIGVDITDRKRAQEALRQSEESLRRLLESSEQGVWIIDAGHVTTFVNRRLAAMLGTDMEDMIGKPAQLREGESGELLREILMGSQGGGGRVTFTTKFRRANGDEFWAHVTVNPLYTYDGLLTGHAAVLTDVTSRKRAEESRDLLRHAYNTLLNNVSDRILRFNRELTCVYANFEFEKGSEDGSPIVEGRSWDDLKPVVKPAKEWEAAIKKAFQKGERVTVDGAKIGSNAAPGMSVTFVPEFGPGSVVTHVLAVVLNAVPAGMPATGVAKLI
jgi:PAS domain S-box-containing protein